MLTVHIENGRVEVRRRPRPRRPAGFALLRLICGGICNTDIELLRGYYNFRGTPGHEFVGEVVEADNRKLVGRRVVGEINLECGRCEWCRRGLGRHCGRRKVLGIVKHPGAFSEYFTLPERNLHVVPEAVPTERAVFTEPLAAACEILDQVRIPKSDAAAVLGDGKLGLLIAQVLAAQGIAVRLYGRHKEKLRIARAAGIRTHDKPESAPHGYNWVVEATGSAEGFRQAVEMVRPRGTIVMKSTVHGAVPIDTAPLIVNEITLVGSRCGRFEPALKLAGDTRIRLSEMISDRIPLAEAPQAFARAMERGVIKVLLEGCGDR
jgi:alcohol dehydrogenase